MRAIDADALLKSCRIVPVHDGENWAYTHIVTDGDILNAPTITIDDLRPKGRWIDSCVRDWTCSECGGKVIKVRNVDGYCFNDLPSFCPDCGAKME